MIRPVLHVPTGRRFDVAGEMPAEQVRFLADLHANLPHGEHHLRCETAGGDQRVYVYKLDGNYWVRHYPGGGHSAGHRIIPESDEHRRGKDYVHRAFDSAGLPAATEVTSNNGTKSDVIGFGKVVTAAEIQISLVDARTVKTRDTKARRASAITTPGLARRLADGIHPVWAQMHAGRADWVHQVPSIQATVTSSTWSQLPPKGTVHAGGPRRIVAERCRVGSRWDRCPLTKRNFCGGWHPLAVATRDDPDERHRLTVDEVYVRAASGLLIPLRYHAGGVYLTDPESAALYEELGGVGEYAPGRAMRSALGPCRYRGHSEPVRPAQVKVQPEPEPQPAELELFPQSPSSLSHGRTSRRASHAQREGTCAGGCGARPQSGAEYCQACRLLAKMRGSL